MGTLPTDVDTRLSLDGEEVTWGVNFSNRCNVEVCTTVKAIKYIHKYIYKGCNKATLQINENDEITRYFPCRYIGPTQASCMMEYLGI